ncbi:MAG TPA: TetR/AcrR family transcriptional regulator [Trichormus sp.]|jgi:AcrR family transcriptional regulator
MVRPRADNYEQRRQAILDAAAGLFARESFAGTSIAAIAEQCGTSKALLYHYYPSKETLLYDMLCAHCTLLEETAEDAVDHDQSPEIALQSLIRSLMNVYITSRDKHVVLLNDLGALPEEQQLQIRELQRSVVHVIKKLLVRLRPELRAEEQTSLAMYLMGAINWTYTWFSTDGPMSAQEYADMATSLFLNGVRSAPAISHHC